MAVEIVLMKFTILVRFTSSGLNCAFPGNQGPFETSLFDPDWEFFGAIHGTLTVLKREPSCNFMENITFLGLSVGPLYMIIMKLQME
jgi:hypothetical protein